MKTKQPQDYLGRSMSGPTDFYLRREQLQKARTGGKQALKQFSRVAASERKRDLAAQAPSPLRGW